MKYDTILDDVIDLGYKSMQIGGGRAVCRLNASSERLCTISNGATAMSSESSLEIIPEAAPAQETLRFCDRSAVD